MPQLMPLYWIFSTIFSLLLMFMLIKLYGNYTNNFLLEDKEKVSNHMQSWYW